MITFLDYICEKFNAQNKRDMEIFSSKFGVTKPNEAKNISDIYKQKYGNSKFQPKNILDLDSREELDYYLGLPNLKKLIKGNFRRGVADVEKVYNILYNHYNDFSQDFDIDFKDTINQFNQIVTNPKAGSKIRPDVFLSFPNYKELKKHVGDIVMDLPATELDVDRQKIENELPNSEVIYEDDEIIAVRIGSYEDSRHFGHAEGYGKKCAWCVATKSTRNYWDDYTKKHNLSFVYIVNKKTGEKQALTLTATGGDQEVYNTADQLTSGWHLVNNRDGLVKAIRQNGFPEFKSSDDYVLEEDGEFITITELSDGSLGQGSAVRITTRLYKDTQSLIDAKDGWGKKVEEL